MRDPDAVMVATPADHIILDEDVFENTICNALEYAAGSDALITLGIVPDKPDTNFGYIQGVTYGVEEEGKPVKVKTFTEKPEGLMFGGKTWTLVPLLSSIFRHSSSVRAQILDESSRNRIISLRFTLTPRSAMDSARIIASTLCSFPPQSVVVIARDVFAITSWTASGFFITSISVLKRMSRSPYWRTSRIFFIVHK